MKKEYNEPFVQYCEVSASAIMVGSDPMPDNPGDDLGSQAPRRAL